MNIHEYQAKEILKNYGLPVLKGKSYNKNLETLDADMKDLKGPPWVVKSQIHAGGRGAGHFKNSLNDKGGVQSNYEYYDDYQRWAYNAVRKSDPYLLPFYFSKINVNFIQKKVVEYVKKERGIEINTSQDTEGLLTIMLSNYTHAWHNKGIIGSNKCATKPNEDPSTFFTNILAKLNQYTIQQYVKMVLSTLNITEYYIRDISNLPMPISQPVPTSNKGINQLGFVGFFEDNHEFTRNINSFNTRNVLPGKLN